MKLLSFQRKRKYKYFQRDDEETVVNLINRLEMLIEEEDEYNYTEEKYKDVIKFLLKKEEYDLIGNNIKNTNINSKPLIFKIITELFTFYKLFESEYKTKLIDIEPINVEIKENVIFNYVWSNEKFKGNLNYIKDFKYQETNHFLVYLEGLNCYLTVNGNHSIAIGILKQKGNIECRVKINILDLYRELKSKNMVSDTNVEQILEVMIKKEIKF